jgi:hypothetical protein
VRRCAAPADLVGFAGEAAAGSDAAAFLGDFLPAAGDSLAGLLVILPSETLAAFREDLVVVVVVVFSCGTGCCCFLFSLVFKL